MAQIGLKDLHIAILTEDTKESLKYAVPENIINGINANINPSSESTEVYADDGLVDVITTLSKVDVEIELLDLPLEIRAKLLGDKIVDGIYVENKNRKAPFVALGFKSEKLNGKFRYVWLLKGTAQLMSDEYATKKKGVDLKNAKIKLVFMPTIHDGNWKLTGDEDMTEFTKAATWFDEVPGQTE